MNDPYAVERVTRPFDLTLRPPGSKSITCRALVLAALARGESRLVGVLRSDDTEHLLEALRTLGTGARWEGEDLVVDGVGGRFPRGGEVNLGDGGAPTRFLIAAACLAEAPVVVDGSPRMRERPVSEGVSLLRALGARIEHLDAPGRLPVRVRPSPELKGGPLEVPTTASSQFVTALLLIGAGLEDGLAISFRGEPTSASYIALTERVLRDWKVPLEAGPRVRPATIAGRRYEIEPDASSAVYWWTAALLIDGARMTIAGLADSAQPDARYVDLLNLPSGALEVQGDRITTIGTGLRPAPGDVCARHVPDAALMLAAWAAMAEPPAPTRISGLRTLRVKETDRIAALANELERIGCRIAATDDALRIDPAGRHRLPVRIETYNDHRMAMAFAILGLARGGISIRDPACTAKSYPGFWSDLQRLYDSASADHTVDP